MTEHKIIFGDSRSLNKIEDKSVQLIILHRHTGSWKIMVPKIKSVLMIAMKNI